MLRQSLSRWLDRKSVRPVMSRVGRTAAKPRTTPAAAAYQTGDVDDLHESEQLDLMEDIPIEPLGRPASATARDPHGRATPAQALLSRLEETHPLSPAGATRSVEERAVARAPRRVMSTLRRPHTPSTPSTTTAENAISEAPRGTLGHHRAADEEGAETEADHAAGAATSTTADASQDGGAAADPDVSAVASTLGGAGDASPAVAKSADAYRFLLNHIDAEIAALQRRHSSVTTRRQHVQTKQTQRIKELFELMEAPWTLLPTEEQPALPATGVDVYIKEQQVARQRRQGGSSGSPSPSSSPPSASSSSASSPAAAAAAAGTSAHDGPDKMYVLALHKNYKSMPAGRKRFYEEAAHYNAAVREEMKYQLTRGCARFEAFLDRVKECTMEMAREGQVPELPSGHAHRIAAAGGQRSERWRTTSGGSGSGGSGASGSATRRKAGAASAESKSEVSADESSTPEADTAEQPAAPATGKGKKAVAAASRRVKAAAKAKTKTAAPPKRKGGAAKATKAAKTSSTRSSAAAKQKKTAKVAPPSKKSAAGSAKSGGAGSSRSIPLPDLNQLALKKIKQLATPPGKGSKATKTKAVGGKKKKK